MGWIANPLFVSSNLTQHSKVTCVDVDTKYGAVAQLGERLPCTEEVAGSTPVSSTRPQWRRGRKVMRRIANPICVGASPTDASMPS